MSGGSEDSKAGLSSSRKLVSVSFEGGGHLELDLHLPHCFAFLSFEDGYHQFLLRTSGDTSWHQQQEDAEPRDDDEETKIPKICWL